MFLLILLFFKYFFKQSFGAIEYLKFMVFELLNDCDISLFLLLSYLVPSMQLLQTINLALPLEQKLNFIVL